MFHIEWRFIIFLNLINRMLKLVEWIMRIKIKYIILLAVLLFVSGLIVLHIANDNGVETIIESHHDNIIQDSYVGSDHVPDYVLEEEALPMTDTMEELDGW